MPDEAEFSSEVKLAFQHIGEFLFWFSQIEQMLRFKLIEALELTPELRDVVPASYQFRTLCDVTAAACRAKWPEARTAEFGELIEACKRLNEQVRHHIVHGTWNQVGDAHIEMDGKFVRVDRASMGMPAVYARHMSQADSG